MEIAQFTNWEFWRGAPVLLRGGSYGRLRLRAQLRQFVVISVTKSPDRAWTKASFATTLNNWTIGVGARVASFSPETIKLLRSVLDDAWESMRPEERAGTSKTAIAARILDMAATGERDPIRLRAEAVTEVVTAAL